MRVDTERDARVVVADELTFDALMSEIGVSKMRIPLADVMFDKDADGKGRSCGTAEIPMAASMVAFRRKCGQFLLQTLRCVG